MPIEPKKQETIVGLKVESKLSPREMDKAQIELARLGPVGATALQVLRAAGAAVSNLDAAVESMVLAVDGITDSNSRFKAAIRLELTLDAPPSLPDELLGLPLRSFRGKGEFDIRCLKGFIRLNLETLRDLVGRTADDLLELKNFGPSSLGVVRTFLAQKGLHLKGEVLDHRR